MERKQRTLTSSSRGLAGTVALLVLIPIAGCGEQKDYRNDPRPPAPINVAAYISPNRISVSPSSFGAGPIVVVVTNQSSTSQEATFETEGSSGQGSGLAQTTGPINPGDTGQIKLFVRQGVYRLRVNSGAIPPATVFVDGERNSAQNQVLQP